MKVKLTFALVIVLLSTFACLVAKPAQESNQSAQPKTIQQAEFVVSTRSVAMATLPQTPKPPRRKVIKSTEDTVQIKLDMWEMTALNNLSVNLALNQKLVILPDPSFGHERWFVYTDNSEMLTLDPSIDFTTPPTTGWVWTPNFTGSTTILIHEPKSLCADSETGCMAPPLLYVEIPVKIVVAP